MERAHPSRPNLRHHPAARSLALLLFFLLLALLMTYPLAGRLGSALLGAPGDNYEFMFKLRFFADRLREGSLWPLTTPNLFYPFGYDLRFAETTYTSLSLALPVTLLAGEVAGYNWVTLLSFALSGLAAYLWARLLTRQHGPAVIAGILFAFSAFRMYRAGIGHLLYLGTFFVPLLFLYIELLIRQRRLRWGVLAGICYALTTLSSWVYGYMTALAVLVYALVRLWPWRSRLRDRKLWQAGAAFVLTAVLLLGVPAYLLAQIRQGAGLSFSLADADLFSGDVLALLALNPAHPLLGSGVLRESFVPPIGWLAAVLALFSLRKPRGQVVAALWAVLALAVILSWGLTLHWNGERLYLAVPGIVERAFGRIMSTISEQLALHPQRYWPLHQSGSIFVPLPAYLLYLFVPFFNSIREWTTFVMLTTPAVAGLAAWTLARLGGRRRPLILAVVALLALAELAVAPFAYGYTETFTQPLVSWLRERPDVGAVARFPLRKWTNGVDQYDAYVSGRPTTDAYAAFQPNAWREAYPTLDSFPASESLALLRRWQVRYVVVSPSAYGEGWAAVEQQIAATAGLRPLATVPYLSRFRAARLLPPAPSSPGAYVPVSEWLPQPAGTVLDQVRIYELAP